MKSSRMGSLLLAAAVAVVASVATASAQGDAAANYPNKPIRVIVPFAAGGGNDIFARLVGNKLSKILGQPVINENKPGGQPGSQFKAMIDNDITVLSEVIKAANLKFDN